MPAGNDIENSTPQLNDLNSGALDSGAGKGSSISATNAASVSPALDLPELPGVPLDTPVHERSDSPAPTKKDDEEDIDFDDLTRRFEALKLGFSKLDLSYQPSLPPKGHERTKDFSFY